MSAIADMAIHHTFEDVHDERASERRIARPSAQCYIDHLTQKDNIRSIRTSVKGLETQAAGPFRVRLACLIHQLC
jgi:hypothetical protein